MIDKGVIFNIQKFSIHDGPGIRTTVFLKGCPLRCKWCSNPESQSYQPEVTWDATKCMHCLQCINSCSNKAVHQKNECIIVDSSLCHNTLSCVTTCPNKALHLEGEYKGVNDIVNICMQDYDFYEESGGGVTISGGEGMGQPTFLRSLTKALKEKNIHIAIETTGYIASDVFQDLAPRFDLLLFDVKHYDSSSHKEGTGVPNEIILENLKWAVNHKIKLLPRIPVIPTFNASLNDALHFSLLLNEIGITSVQLLPFHQFGEKKYEQLNKEYTLKNLQALYPEDLEEYKNIFINHGIDCFF